MDDATRAGAQLARPAPSVGLALHRPGFVAGFSAPLGGFAFLARTPAAWPPALVPVVLATAISGGLGFLVVRFLPHAIAGWIGATGADDPWLVLATQVVATALALAAAVLVAIALAQPLSGPALEAIVRHHDAALGEPPRPALGFWAGVSASMSSLVVSFAFGAPLLAVLFLVGVVVPGAELVVFPLKLAVSAVLVAWDFCDYPLSVRGVPVGARVTLVRRHAAAMLGFGFAIAVTSLVPCGLFLILPAGVAGAARLTLAMERADPAPGRS